MSLHWTQDNEDVNKYLDNVFEYLKDWGVDYFYNSLALGLGADFKREAWNTIFGETTRFYVKVCINENISVRMCALGLTAQILKLYNENKHRLELSIEERINTFINDVIAKTNNDLYGADIVKTLQFNFPGIPIAELIYSLNVNKLSARIRIDIEKYLSIN